MDRLRIMHVHDKPANGGGVRAHVDALTLALSRAGHEVSTLRLVAPSDYAAPGERVFPRSFDPVRSIPLRRRLLAAIKDFAPDAVHLHAGFTSLAAPLIGAIAQRWHTIGTLHDVSPFCMTSSRLFEGRELCARVVGIGCRSTGCWPAQGGLAAAAQFTTLIIRSGLRDAWSRLPHIIVPSSYLRGLALQHGFDPAKTHIFPHFTALPSLGDDPQIDPPLIIYVGAITSLKGSDIFVDALTQIASLRWDAVLIGEGPLRANLQQQIEQNGLASRIKLVGALGTSDVTRYRRQSTLAVFPSRVAESFGLSGLESLAAARPVVGFAQAGALEWLRDGETGLAATPHDAEGLAFGIRRLLAGPAYAANLGENGRRLVGAIFSERHYLSKLDVLLKPTSKR